MKAKYLYDKDYRVISVNGVHGGRIGSDYLVNFFFDHEALPEMVEYQKDGKVKYSKLKNDIDRSVLVGLVMNAQSLAALRDWINTQLGQKE